MPEITYSAHAVLPDGSFLLSVVETTRVPRFLRSPIEVSETVGYVLKAGCWWGKGNECVTVRDPRFARLTEIAMQQQVRRAVDLAIE